MAVRLSPLKAILLPFKSLMEMLNGLSIVSKAPCRSSKASLLKLVSKTEPLQAGVLQ